MTFEGPFVMIYNIITEYNKLTQRENKTWYDWVGIGQEIEI